MQPAPHLSSRSECALISRLAAVAALVLNLAVLTAAQSPESMTIQGLLTDSEGNPVGASSALIKVTLYDSESGDSMVWENSPVTVPLDAGVYALTLPGVGLGQVDFSRPLWISLAVDGTTLAPRQPLTGVPYSLATRGFRVLLGTGGNGPNIKGGHEGNVIAAGRAGATISGGGSQTYGYNVVQGDYGTVGGGSANQACNYLLTPEGFCTVGGGLSNSAQDEYGTIAGGRDNNVPDAYGAVGGGYLNAAGKMATVAGGELNMALGSHSMAAGYRARAVHAGSFVWSDRSLTSGTDADNFTSGGPNQFLIRAAGGVGINATGPMPGGLSVNGPIESRSGFIKFPDGTTQNSAGWGLMGNSGTTPGTHFLGTSDAKALEMKVGGLRVIRMTPYDAESAPNLIGGHYGNTIDAGVVGATIAGGGTLDALHRITGNYGAVGGGVDNQAGLGGFVGAGQANRAAGFASAIAGGEENQASGRISTVPGGSHNVAGGDYSFAAGRYAHVRTPAETGDADGDEGSFVWADASEELTAFRSSGPNQFIVRATGGIRLVRGSAEPKATAAALQVESDGLGEAAWIKQRVDAVYPVAALLKPPTSTNHFLSGQTQDATTTVTKFHITSAGTYVAGSDIAEALPAVGDPDAFEPGDVLVISRSIPGGVEPSSQAYDPAVIGVLSTRPGFLGADKDGVTEVLDSDVPVAIAGIVPVKVTAENGPIRPGDPLTTSSLPGHAMRASSVTIDGIPSYPSGVLVGKAMGALDSGTGVIKMFVMCQ